MNPRGRVLDAIGGSLHVRLPGIRVGDGVCIGAAAHQRKGVVRSVGANGAYVAVHGSIAGVAIGDPVRGDPKALRAPLGMSVLGRSFDASCTPLDGGRALTGVLRDVAVRAPSASMRTAITRPFWSGVRAIDALLTIGRGARIGLFGAPGAGKSTLLQAFANARDADAVVVGLVGERGREAQAWITQSGARMTLTCATSDRGAAERVHAARLAVAQAAALRSLGLHVLLIIDSLARFGAALRELAVEQGESCGRGGFPASVFADLAALVEVAGSTTEGSITLIATVLSDGDERDPLSEAARSLLDGHIVLSAELAQAGRFPAIDVLASTSRTMQAVVSAEHAASARVLRTQIARLADEHDARRLGLLPPDPLEARIEGFLRQGESPSEPPATLAALAEIADTWSTV